MTPPNKGDKKKEKGKKKKVPHNERRKYGNYSQQHGI